MKFEELNLNNPLLNALSDLGIDEATTIQEKVFPVAMAGKDICGIAQTGTGKTFAYLLPILRQHKFSKEKHPQMLILVPTRELVLQVEEEARRLSAYMTVRILGVFGGVNIKTQLKAVNEGVDLIVATPGRLIDLIYSGSLRMKSIKRLVIDEMDEMLNLGFRTQLKNVLDALPIKRQNLLFSATITQEVEELLDVFFTQPIRIEAAPTGTPLENIAQSKYLIPNFNTKVNLLKLLFSMKEDMTKVLIFVSTKKMADLLFNEMEESLGETLGVIHSNKDQNHRMRTIQNFHDGTYKAVIATDIVARGIDVASVSHVVCFDIPDVVENYIHRIGRTGRADKKGNAMSFVTENEKPQLLAIEAFMNYQIEQTPLPENLEISDILIDEEKPKVFVKEISMKLPKNENVGPAFHPKSLKNSVHKKPLTFKDKMAMKYKKPKKEKAEKVKKY